MINKLSTYTYIDKLTAKNPMLYSYIFECIKQRVCFTNIYPINAILIVLFTDVMKVNKFNLDSTKIITISTTRFYLMILIVSMCICRTILTPE